MDTISETFTPPSPPPAHLLPIPPFARFVVGLGMLVFLAYNVFQQRRCAAG